MIIVKDGKKYYFLNKERQTEVTNSLLEKYHITASELSKREDLDLLFLENDYFLALDVAKRKLKNIKTEHEIKTILKDELFNNKTIDDVITKLKNMGLINDRIYSKIYLGANISKKSFQYIKEDLRLKNISTDIIDNLKLGVDERIYLRRHILNIFKRTKKNTHLTKQKILRTLIKKGYKLNDIKTEIELFFKDNKIDDELFIEKDILKISKRYQNKENKKELITKALIRKGYQHNLIIKYIK